jgi:hypothetical protein
MTQALKDRKSANSAAGLATAAMATGGTEDGKTGKI